MRSDAALLVPSPGVPLIPRMRVPVSGVTLWLPRRGPPFTGGVACKAAQFGATGEAC